MSPGVLADVARAGKSGRGRRRLLRRIRLCVKSAQWCHFPSETRYTRLIKAPYALELAAGGRSLFAPTVGGFPGSAHVVDMAPAVVALFPVARDLAFDGHHDFPIAVARIEATDRFLNSLRAGILTKIGPHLGIGTPAVKALAGRPGAHPQTRGRWCVTGTCGFGQAASPPRRRSNGNP
jgi:hypothetical protein